MHDSISPLTKQLGFGFFYGVDSVLDFFYGVDSVLDFFMVPIRFSIGSES